MRRSNIFTLIVIAGLFAFSLWALLPPDSERLGHKGMRLGLDLKGGTHLVYEADLSQRPEGQTPDEAMAGAFNKIERRVNAYGVSEPIIQRQGSERLSVQLPGIRNIEEAVALIGSTAKLEFKERVLEDGQVVYSETGLTGDDLKSATVGAHPDPLKAGQPVVHFEFESEAAEVFAQLTTRLAGTGDEIAIFLDQEEISHPTVREPITGGIGFIEGGFTLEEARRLAIQLNEGALPVPLRLLLQDDVEATLGAQSVQKSLLAAIIGLAIVLAFMVLYYRVPGMLASGALLIYASFVLTAFKLIPVTLTLAGIAAFILSIGMAVDANVLIFERLKEELRGGRSLRAAIEAGFDRAWPSIRDSNVSTLITCGILYWMGSSFGEPSIMGFAIILGIGVIISMFTAIVVTRSFLRAFAGTRLGRRRSLFVPVGGVPDMAPRGQA